MATLWEYKISTLLLALAALAAGNVSWWVPAVMAGAGAAVFLTEKRIAQYDALRRGARRLWPAAHRAYSNHAGAPQPAGILQGLADVPLTPEDGEALDSFAESVFPRGATRTTLEPKDETWFADTLSDLSDVLKAWGKRPYKSRWFRRFLYDEIKVGHEPTLVLVEHLERARARAMNRTARQDYLERIREVWLDETAKRLSRGDEE